MKYIMSFIVLAMLFTSCEKEEQIILDMMISPEDITKIELRADHKTLLPNGIAKMEFRPIVYATKEVTAYVRKEDGTFETVVEKTEAVVPSDQVPEGLIKVYDETGKELKDRIYSTTTDKPGMVKNFYATCRDLKSANIPITIRELPDLSYEEIVIPVVFHVISLPATSGPVYNVSVQYLEEQLKMVSDAFNSKKTTDPNGGNAKIVFKLAEYDPAGNKMQTPGMKEYVLSASEAKSVSDATNALTGYKALLLKKKSTLIFEPSQYFNIWLIKFTTSTSVSGSASYKTALPTIVHTDYELNSIPGISFKSKADKFTKSDITDCLQAGIIVSFTPFFSPSVQGTNEFNLATPIALYYGVLETRCDDYSLLNKDGDNDYCPDTYNYYTSFYPSVYKANNLDNQPEICPERPMEYFTSFNVMDVYSRKNSISVDQAKRVRQVLEQCPERYAYKSKFAFTGK